MLLRTQILLLVSAALLLVGLSVGVPAWMLLRSQGDEMAELRRQRQAAQMDRVLDEAARPLADAARELAGDPGFAEMIAARDAQALRPLLVRWLDAEAERNIPIARADITARGNQVLAAIPAYRAGEAIMRNERLLRDIQPGETARGIVVDAQGGTPWLVVALRVDLTLVSVAAPLDPFLRQITARLGAAGAGMIALDGRRLPGSTEGFWDSLGEPSRPRPAQLVVRGPEGERLLLVATQVNSPDGVPAGRLLVAQDVTDEFLRQELLALTSAGIFISIVLLACLLVYRRLQTTLDPLTSLSRTLRALASGDIFASADAPRRKDEVGEIARALDTLRDSGLALDRLKVRERISVNRQQALIGAELLRLASVLDGPEREEAAAMMQRLERTPEAAGAILAEAFERMAAGVLARHHRLSELLAERTRDLDIVRSALAERMQLNRLREELELARSLQISSLPSSFPVDPRFRLHAAMLPAKEVGGDFYDFLLLEGRRLAIFIGDASGKGVGAALFIAMARSLLRSAVARGASPAEALAQANDVLSADNPTMMFATAFVGVLDLESRRLSFANAGHNPPMLLPWDGRPDWMRATAGIALGVMEGFEYESAEIILRPGDTLLLYTDGVTEAIASDGGFYGEERLSALASGTSKDPTALVAAVFADVAEFAQDEPQADDITLLGLTLVAAPAPAPANADAPAHAVV
jgi:sigma-B regulation protein RsbU (phosphoserine phosphatase)